MTANRKSSERLTEGTDPTTDSIYMFLMVYFEIAQGNQFFLYRKMYQDKYIDIICDPKVDISGSSR